MPGESPFGQGDRHRALGKQQKFKARREAEARLASIGATAMFGG